MSIVTCFQIRAALLACALCVLAEAASAQAAPVQYWLPSGMFGLGGHWTDGGSAATYRNFPGFEAGYASGDDWRANFKTGAFVRSEAASFGLTGLGRAGIASDFGALTAQSTVAGYAFKGGGDLPVSVYAGFDTLTYRPGFGSALAPFNSDVSVAAGYTARAGIAFQPAPNVTLSLGASFTQQQSGDGDPDARLLPGQSPFYGTRR